MSNPLLVILFTGLVTIVVVGIVVWGRVRRVEAEASVKLRMVERGYTPEQIAQVMQTKMPRGGRGRYREGSPPN